jgi:hypothetical protein
MISECEKIKPEYTFTVMLYGFYFVKVTVFRDGEEVDNKLFSPFLPNSPSERHFKKAHDWAYERIKLLSKWEVV